MANAPHMTAALAAQTLPEADGAPEWIHLLPAGPSVQTIKGDSRGPYQLSDPQAVIAASFAAADRLPIDENHATDYAARTGIPSPARGWITAMEAREDGIWGRVEWTKHGRELVESREYRGISPVITHQTAAGGPITGILRASLTNNPGLVGLTTLHMENADMGLMDRLKELLGLGADADEDAVFDAIKAMKGKKDDGDTAAMSAQLAEIGKALGVEDGDHTAILSAAQAAGASDKDGVIVALQADLTKVATQLNALTESTGRAKAEAFVDGEIEKGRVGVKPMRDHYIARFMADQEAVKAELSALPILGGGGQIIPSGKPPKDGETALSAEQRKIARMLGVREENYIATLTAERGQDEEAL